MTYLLHLNTVDEDVGLLIFVVKEEKAAIFHDRVVFLGDLVSLGQVGVDVVFAIKFNQWQDSASETQ